jgi:hypothetical protein
MQAPRPESNSLISLAKKKPERHFSEISTDRSSKKLFFEESMPTNKKIYRYIFISSALHFCLLAVLILQTNYRQKDESNHTLEVSVLSSEEAAKLRLTPNAKTIVESDSQTANHKLNESAKFLSEKTNSVEKSKTKQLRPHAWLY